MATNSTPLRQRAGVLLLLLGLIAAMAPVTFAAPAWAELQGNADQLPSDGGTYVAGNTPNQEYCAGYDDGVRQGSVEGNTSSLTGVATLSGGVLTLVDDPARSYELVLVKAGNQYYRYAGSGLSGDFNSPKTGSISNFVICWDDVPVSTTGDATVDVTKSWWDMSEQEIDPATGASASFDIELLQSVDGTRVSIDTKSTTATDGSVTFTGLALDGVYGVVIRETGAVAPDGCVLTGDFELADQQGALAASGPLTVGQTTTFDVDNWVDCPPRITIDKVWTGDSTGEAVFDVTFFGEGSSEPVEVAVGGSIAIPWGTGGVRIDERVSGLGSCTSTITDVSDDLPLLRDQISSDLQLTEESTADYEAYFDYYQQLDSFTVTFANDVDCPSIASTPSRASVEVLKEWTVDGTVVDAPEGAAPAFDVALSLGDNEVVNGTAIAGGTARFVGGRLTSAMTYDVMVAEDADTLPDDPFNDETRTCEFMGTTYTPTDPTVRASATGGSVTVTATNLYECSEVAGESYSSLEVDVDKVWNATTADDGLTEFAAPADYTPTFEVTLTDGEGVAIGEAETLTPGAIFAFSGLVDGDDYGLVWTEVDPLATFTDADTCTMNDELSVIGGTASLIGGEDTAVTLDARNVYDCSAVRGVTVVVDKAEEIADTGVPALLLTLLGLASMGLGGGLLRRTKRN